MESHFQVGFVVPDLEAAMEELGAALGVEMIGPQERDLGKGLVLRIAFARTPAPYLELIEGPPGSIWDSTGGARIHHLGYWSEDMDADSARLEAAGMAREIDLGFARYHGPGSATGARVELISTEHREAFYERWGLPES
jgi:hypothetical protein